MTNGKFLLHLFFLTCPDQDFFYLLSI